jgi:hypothetical protein
MKTILFLFFTVLSVSAQYQLERSVIVIGGGHVTGGPYSGTTTIGQPAAGGFLTSGPSAHYSGFWLPELSPTAAGVSIAGRVLASSGVGLTNATVHLTGQGGETLVARTSSFGYYRFDDVEIGQTVLISVSSKRYVYAPRTLSLHDNVTDVDFLPVEEGK